MSEGICSSCGESIVLGVPCAACAANADFDPAKATLVRQASADTSPTQPTHSQDLSKEILANRYRLIRLLGSGSFGEVFEAEDETLARRVAVKRIRIDARADPKEIEELQKRSLREARVAAQLRHPNIVAIYDVFAEQSERLIVMELVEGQTLDELIQDKGRLSLARARDIVAQAGAALDYAHQQKVVHRDIKPANIMVDRAGRVQVMDFGVAKSEASGALTATGHIVGTPNYMSPEQARGESLDGRSDLFSLACILYECLTGARPFFGTSVTATLLRIVSEEPDPIDYDAIGADARLEVVLDRALAKERNERFASASALVEALDRVVTGAETMPLGSAGTPAETMNISATSAPKTRESFRASSGNDSSSAKTAMVPSPTGGRTSPTLRRADMEDATRGSRWFRGTLAVTALLAVLAAFAWQSRRSSSTPPRVLNEAPVPTAAAKSDAGTAVTERGERELEAKVPAGGESEPHSSSLSPVESAAAASSQSRSPDSPKTYPLPADVPEVPDAGLEQAPPPLPPPPPKSSASEPSQQAPPPDAARSRQSAPDGRGAEAKRGRLGRDKVAERAEAQVVQVMERFYSRQASFKRSRGRYASSEEIAQRAEKIGRGNRSNRPQNPSRNPSRFGPGNWIAFGYRFEVQASENRFSLWASPTQYPRSGKRSFFIDETGTLRGADKGGAAAGPEDLAVNR